MNLNEAWARRRPIWAEGTRLIEEGNKLWKEISALPATGSVACVVWYQLSEMNSEAAAKVSRGYALRAEADGIWNDAVIDVKGSKTKLVWVFDENAKAYDCRLDTGEEFKA